MLCLSLLIGGKAGKILRRISLVLVILLISCLTIYILALKNFTIQVLDVKQNDDKYRVRLMAANNFILPLILLDLNAYDFKDNIIKKITNDLPLNLPKYTSKEVIIDLSKKNYKYFEVQIKSKYIVYNYKIIMNQT